MAEIDSNTKVVVLTGAGISAESGIKTFRDADGLWENHAIEDVATPYAWQANPELVWQFYQARRRQLLGVEPNSAHRALVDLERFLGDNFLLVTQNVDDLHGRAGSKNLIHMHGELRILRCEKCNETFDYMSNEHLTDQYVACPSCGNERLRPHIVWFHEVPLQMSEIYSAVEQCDVFITIGTSGHVYPAAGLIEVARQNGAYCIGINLDNPMNIDLHDEFLQGKAGELLPKYVKKIIN